MVGIIYTKKVLDHTHSVNPISLRLLHFKVHFGLDLFNGNFYFNPVFCPVLLHCCFSRQLSGQSHQKNCFCLGLCKKICVLLVFLDHFVYDNNEYAIFWK